MTNYPQLTKEIQENEIKVIMHTNKGDMTLKLFPEIAPKTVQNFVELSKKVTTMGSRSTVSSMTL